MPQPNDPLPAGTARAPKGPRRRHGEVVGALGRRIVAGVYPVGTSLPGDETLSAEFGVSRSVLREAVRVLSAKGLVQATPRIGTRVRPREQWSLLDPDVLAWRCARGPDAEFLGQLAEMREILEPAAAMLAARRRTPEQMADIDTAFAAMAAAQTLHDWVRADLGFHRAVFMATGNELLVPLLATIASALEMLLGITARDAGDVRAGLDCHGRVAEAIRLQDTQAAAQAMTRLLADSRERLVERVA